MNIVKEIKKLTQNEFKFTGFFSTFTTDRAESNPSLAPAPSKKA